MTLPGWSYGFRWWVDVGWTGQRPVVPDENWCRVEVAAWRAQDARLIAAQMVGARDTCVMVTSAEIVRMEV